MTDETPRKIFSLYKITNLENNKLYIGQSVNPNSRWYQHKNNADKDKPSMVITQAIKKYGNNKFEFEIIASCSNQDDANDLETILVSQYESHISTGKGYNVSLGGMNAPKTDVWKQTMRDHWADPKYKTKVAEAIRQAYANQTPEEKAQSGKLRSEIQKGKHRSPNTEFKIGHQHSEEVLQRISDALQGKPSHMKGKKHTPETLKKISDSLLGKTPWNKGTKGIMQINSGSFKPEQEPWNKGKTGLPARHRKLTDENVMEIVSMMTSQSKTKEELADQFGVKERVIRDIMAGRTWSSITLIKRKS